MLCARPIYEGNEISCLQIEVLNTELRCPICLNILRDPVATECMHRFCAGCIDMLKIYGVNNLCPNCREELPDIPTSEQLFEEGTMMLVRWEQTRGGSPAFELASDEDV